MTKKNVKYIVLLLFLLSAIVLPSFISFGSVAHAADSDNELNFDNYSIEEYLSKLDLSAYPKDASGSPALIEGGFVEYCYTDNPFNQSNYALYLFIYNPSQIQFSERPGANSLNIATSYNDKGEPCEYSNIALDFLEKTSGENDKLFYKFKVSNVTQFRSIETEYNKKYGKRRYDIAGIQLCTLGSSIAKDYGVSYTFYYTGYSKGYSEESREESTLAVSGEDLLTVSIGDIKSSSYISDGYISKNSHLCDQLNSVYFAVPKRVIDKYGKLCRVQAEWYEYSTNPIWVVGNNDTYNHLLPFVGLDKDKGYNSTIKYSLYANPGSFGPSDQYPCCDYAYNNGDKRIDKKELYRLDYIFLANTKSAGDTVISSTQLKNYIDDRSIDKKDLLGKYNSELFNTDVGEGRISGDIGKTEVNIWADETYDLRAVNVTQSWWQKLFGLDTVTSSTFNGIEAIQEVTEKDLEFDDNGIANRLFISSSDSGELKDYYENYSENNNIYLFRFACTNTYTAQVQVRDDPLSGVNLGDQNAYMYMTNVFLNFDIITLTFSAQGEYTVLPVVSSPIDIFPESKVPPDFSNGDSCGNAFFTILMVIALVLFIVLAVKVIGWFVKTFKKAKTTDNANVTINMSDYLGKKNKDDKDKKT